MVTHPAAGVGIAGKDTARINNVLCGPERRLTLEQKCEETGKDGYAAANSSVTIRAVRRHLNWHLERNREPNRPDWAGDVRKRAFVRGLESDGVRWWVDPAKAAALPPCSCCGLTFHVHRR